MGFCFSKPDRKELLKENREAIEDNARILSVCKELAPEKLKQEVDGVFSSVRYMTPTVSVGAAQADKKINALAGDLKIALSKDKERALFQAEDIIKDLKAAVAERNSYANK